jgi:DNA-binding LacI/PurR family transcriptional regulator
MTSTTKRPTMLDVARRAGVSRSLVSRVMRDSGSVSERRRQLVQKAAEELGYELNWAARSLSAKRASSGIIGLLLRDTLHPWTADLSRLARPILEEAGYTVLASLLSAPSSSRGLDLSSIEVFRDLQVDGLMLFGSVADEKRLRPLVSDMPLVFAGWGPPPFPADCVEIDDALGVRLVFDHLYGLGHRKIAFMTGPHGATSTARSASYAERAERHGVRPEIYHATEFSIKAGFACATRTFARSSADDMPTAIICVDDLTAIGAMSAAQQSGTRIALTGFNDIEIAGLPGIDLTTLHCDDNTLAQIAVESLLERIRDPQAPLITVKVTPRLIVRGSSTFPSAAGR